MEEIIGNKYKKIKLIGKGSFGNIYIGENIRTQEYVAIKVEPIINELKLLKNESKIYHYLSDCKSIPKLKWFGLDSTNYYMVIDLLGNSLNDLKKEHSMFSLNLTLFIGIQIIEILKFIHNKGLVHRDIKPDNFLFDLNNNRKICLIDFGFCKNIMNKNNEHIEMKKTKNIIGTPTFISINAHDRNELSRRDDMLSLGFMLMYFYFGKLEWEKVPCIFNNEENRAFRL